MTKTWQYVLAAVFLWGCGAPAHAQSYPAKQLRFVVPFAAGGPTDLLARTLAQKLSAQLGRSVIADNRPGAGGNLGADIVAKADPDGYTILMGTNGPLAVNVSLYANLPYDPLRDFAPITQVAFVPNVLVVHPSLPAGSVRELIDLLKANPDKYSYASGGNGTTQHLGGELFKTLAGVKMQHIPYKGGGPALNDVLGGQVPIMFESIATGMTHVRAGKLRALGVTSAQRNPSAPELPTVAEAGVPGFEITAWYGIVAPAGTPPDIVRRLNAELVLAIRSPEIAQRIAALGGAPIANTVEEFQAFLRTDVARWAKVVRESGARAD